MGRVYQHISDAVAKPGRIMQSPKPDVSIEEYFQSCSASISFSSITGDTMSPTMSIVSFMEPIQLFCPASGDGGTISATGLPKRVNAEALLGQAHVFKQGQGIWP